MLSRWRHLATVLLLSACYRGPATTDTTDATPAGAGTTAASSQQQQRPDSTPTNAAMITLKTDRLTYRRGDQIKLTIANRSDRSYTFNPCTRTLEREAGGAWSEVREDRMCTMIAHMLDAKSTVTEQTELGDDLSPGRYRVVLALTEDAVAPTGQSRSVRAASAPIVVTP